MRAHRPRHIQVEHDRRHLKRQGVLLGGVAELGNTNRDSDQPRQSCHDGSCPRRRSAKPVQSQERGRQQRQQLQRPNAPGRATGGRQPEGVDQVNPGRLVVPYVAVGGVALENPPTDVKEDSGVSVGHRVKRGRGGQQRHAHPEGDQDDDQHARGRAQPSAGVAPGVRSLIVTHHPVVIGSVGNGRESPPSVSSRTASRPIRGVRSRRSRSGQRERRGCSPGSPSLASPEPQNPGSGLASRPTV